MNNLEFTCPRAVSAGELVMDPNTGRWGYARQAYKGGDLGTFSTGSGYVMTVSGPAQPGCALYCKNGLITTTPGVSGQSPCATVIQVIERIEDQTTVLVSLN